MIWTVWSLDLCHFCGYRYNIYLLNLYINCICLHIFVAWICCNDFQAWLEGCFASTGVCRRERSQKREVHQRGERVKVRCSSDNRTLYMKQVCLWAMLTHNVSIIFHIYFIILCKYMIRHPQCLESCDFMSNFNEGVRAYTTAANLRWALFLNGWLLQITLSSCIHISRMCRHVDRSTWME